MAGSGLSELFSITKKLLADREKRQLSTMVLNFLKRKSYDSYSVASWLVHYAVLTHRDNPVH